jgi:hypothetical protein
VSDDAEIVVFELVERRRGVTQQGPDTMISHGLFRTRHRAQQKRKKLYLQGVRNTVIVERQVD